MLNINCRWMGFSHRMLGHRKLKKQLFYSDKLAFISAILHANVALLHVCVCVCARVCVCVCVHAGIRVCLISWSKNILYTICL